ncbi:Uma2 family endonuclease [Nostocaceae cyanobacterium CENA369]|uniref:Uma2 family endonuclease n=1 Tax=Dendronalium phyllosphericum CENA369 TaxID=1725256 RepID=A0A8J7LGH0_9NOST|nr:Uma2 family endonuclease [Dendronalium phyllosphericum]MBH8575128.1 Uma2 family endonuclease [Dendronalium phyllosphericum CENA369]
MTASVEYIPITPIEYPDEDGKPMAEGDLQRKCLVYATTVLEIYFQNCPDVYVAGNLFIYYEEGNPESVVAPDVFVVFEVENRDRRSYKTWEENNKTPDFVLEITSKTTRSKDQGAKKGIYAFLGVQEYFQYDPTGDYLNPQLQGLRLVDGNYFPVGTSTQPDSKVSLLSEVLGLELRLEAGKLRFYDPATGQTLLSHEEEAAARLSVEEKAQRLAAKLRELNIDPDNL